MQDSKKSEKRNRRNFLKSGVAIGAGAILAPSIGLGKSAVSSSNDDLWDVIKNRRSVRKFKSDPIPQEDLIKIIDAARMAPTSGNQQPWKFVVIDKRNVIEEIKQETINHREKQYKERNNPTQKDLDERKDRLKKYLDTFLSAPVYIAILTDNNSTYPAYNHWDGPLAAGYLMLAARSLGYGTVFATDSIPVEVTHKVLNIPDTYTRVCFTPVGIPVEWPKTPSKKELESFIIKNSF